MGPRIEDIEEVNEAQQKILDWVGKKEDLFSEEALKELGPNEVLDPDNEVTITNTIGCITDAIEALDLDIKVDANGKSKE